MSNAIPEITKSHKMSQLTQLPGVSCETFKRKGSQQKRMNKEEKQQNIFGKIQKPIQYYRSVS